MAYSADLKERVKAFVAAGGSKADAAVLFGIARCTVFVWLAQPADHVPGKPGPKGARKVDRLALRQAIEAQPDILLSELAQAFGVGISTVHSNVQALGLVRKKNAALQPIAKRRRPKAAAKIPQAALASAAQSRAAGVPG